MIDKKYMFCYKTGIFSMICFFISNVICLNNMVEFNIWLLATLPFIIITAVAMLSLCFIEAINEKLLNISNVFSVFGQIKKIIYFPKLSSVKHPQIKRKYYRPFRTSLTLSTHN